MFCKKIIYLSLVVWQINLIAAAVIPKDAEFTVDRANDYIAANKDSVVQTYRHKYHLMAPIGWINDPNGFIFYQGEYHMFYQYNPYDSFWANMHWGHAKSRDLLHWEDLPVALAPDQSYDINGVYSGSSIEKDGKLYVIYTCVHGSTQEQCVAISEDGIHFEKVAENPVITSADLPENAQPNDFRDPKVLKRGDLYYVVLASRTNEGTGQILLYQSEDLINWSFKSVLLQGTNQQGGMWECPDLYELDGKDVLVTSPIGWPTSGNDYYNTNSVVEFVGEIDWETGKMAVETVKELDHGLDFYATQSMADDQNRRIVVAWMSMGGRNIPTNDLGHKWAGALSLPRQLRIQNGYLAQSPITEVANIYGSSIDLTDIAISDQVVQFDAVSGEIFSLEVVVNLEAARAFRVEVRVNDPEKTVVSYNTETQEVTLNRADSGIVINGSENPPPYARTVGAPLEENRLKLQIFVDASVIEVFVNDGVDTMTANIYPTLPTTDQIRFSAEGSAVIETLRFSRVQM